MELFWGKIQIDRSTGQVLGELPLTDHCLDVASVFRALCDLPSIKRTLDHAAGRPLDSINLDRLSVLALLHDLGKCNWGFQHKKDPCAKITAGHTREVAPLILDPALLENFCATLDCETLAGWFEDEESPVRMLIATVSHHGKPAFEYDIAYQVDFNLTMKFWAPNDRISPMAGLGELWEVAQRAFPAAFTNTSNLIPGSVTLEHRFAGLVMLADWLGSHREAFFPYHHQDNRIDWSRRQAIKALETVGLDVAKARKFLQKSSPDFQDIWGFPPRPLQAWLSHGDRPGLMIAESDTGSGKTEAALAHFLALFAKGEVDSLYFALPTRVAARELYERVLSTIKKVLGASHPPVLLAVPGYVRIDGEPAEYLPSEKQLFADSEHLGQDRNWAAERPKRFLAAPIAVGTIDQALLSTIRVPHAHLRRACLDRALVVIDEVHSSDVYLRAITRRMLSQHLAVGGRALLLSATLGSAARAEYLHPNKQIPVSILEESVAMPYPSVSSPGQAIQAMPGPSGRTKAVSFDPVNTMTAPETIIPGIEEAHANGSRVLVIFNTVARAISFAKQVDANPRLAESLFTCNNVPCPHHGRFTREDRQILDRSVSQTLGMDSPTGPVVLIGTQTLEQSLDIDADWLITDLCPMDVLLQRIGRLHRHDRGPRPTPCCTVLMPEAQDFSEFLDASGQVKFGTPAGLGTVYEDLRILQLTRNLILESPNIQLPRDNRLLVEYTTHPDCLSRLEEGRWEKHRQHIEGVVQAMMMAANSALIPDLHFGEFSFPRQTEERLATRLGLDQRTLQLGGQYTSPFGMMIDELNIPGHLARGLESEQADNVCLVDGALVVHAGTYSYRYSRFGLEKTNESAD